MTWLHKKEFVMSLGLNRQAIFVSQGRESRAWQCLHLGPRPYKTGEKYPGYDKFSDEGGSASKGNANVYIKPESIAERQADWFCLNEANGITPAGLSRINQSIEAFVYCILGAQVNVRSSILGNGGRVVEVRNEFLVLVGDAIRQPDMAKSVQRYQLAVDEAKVRLNLAVCPGTWLMPGNMKINTGSVVCYNNDVNQDTKKSALHLMAGGPSKIKAANSHPSNPIHKAVTQAQGTAPKDLKKKAPPKELPSPSDHPKNVENEISRPIADESHEINKILIGVGTILIAGVAFVSMYSKR